RAFRQMNQHGSSRIGRMKFQNGAVAALVCACAIASFGQQKPQDPFNVEAREYLGNPQSEAAVQKGLEFLAKQQQPDGHWISGNYQNDSAISGLAALAFLSAGHQPGRGKYGEILNRAVDWLADSVQKNGLVGGRGGTAGPPMYGHGFATLALAEIYGMTKRPDFRSKVDSAI